MCPIRLSDSTDTVIGVLLDRLKLGWSESIEPGQSAVRMFMYSNKLSGSGALPWDEEKKKKWETDDICLSLKIKWGLFLSASWFIEYEKKDNAIRFTWTRDSGRFIFKATSSLMNISGYLVLVNKFSRMSNWALVNVVLSRRCFLAGIPKKTQWQYR